MTELKTCTKCGESKPKSEFYRHKGGKDGLAGICKACDNIKVKKWQMANPDRFRENSKQWAKKNPDKRKESYARWRMANRERSRGAEKKRRMADIEKARENDRRKYRKRASTPRGRLRQAITNGIGSSLKRGSKAGRHWETLVGYTIDDLKRHLEKYFQDGMGWNNYGSWHVDHKIPIAVFNFETPEDIDFKRCWALSNLQPLWAEENKIKSDKISFPFQPSLALRLSA